MVIVLGRESQPAGQLGEQLGEIGESRLEELEVVGGDLVEAA